MRSPRLRDTDGTEYDPETGERCDADAGFVNTISEPPESHGAPPDEKQAAAPTMDDVAGMFLRAILGGGWRGRDDDLGVTEEQWEELRVPSDDVADAQDAEYLARDKP